MSIHKSAAALFTLLVSAIVAAQPAPTAMDQAEFVFVGEVVSGSPPEGLTRAKPSTISVRVKQVLRPDRDSLLSGYRDQTVAVRMQNAEALAAGATATFYTRLSSLGKVLEVTEVAHTAAPDVASKSAQVTMAARDGRQVLERQRLAELERRVSEAQVVLTGKVVAIRESAAAVPAEERLSEHNPLWQEAVVEVKETVKGDVAANQVTLRFPSSRDVAWYYAPKLVTGQQGVFFLGADGAVLAQATAVTGTEVPVLATPDSVMPLTASNMQAIRAAIKRVRK